MQFLKYIKQYKINSIFVKNFIASFFVMIIPILIINVLVFNFYYEKASKENSELATSELRFVQENIDRIFKWTTLNSDYMVNDIYVASFLYDNYNRKDSAFVSVMSSVLKNQLDKIKIAEENIESVYLYSKKSKYFISTGGSGYLDTFYDQTVIKNINSDEFNKINFVYNTTGRKIIRIQTPINLYGINEGIVFVNIDYNLLVQNMKKKIFKTSCIFVSKDEEKIIEIGEQKNGNSKKISFVSEDTNFIYTALYQSNINIFSLVLSLSLFSLLFTICSALFLTFRACMPLGNLISVMENSNDWSKNITNKSLIGEIKYILDSYINKVYYSQEIENSLNERIVELKKVQLEALNLQIKPHFLFNTLQIISMLAMDLTNSENNAVFGIKMLSNILKYSLHSKSYTETVANEIEYTKAYVEIQILRYDGRVKVEFDVDKSVLNNVTAKIVLQPLIENSFAHGIIPYKAEGDIFVEIYPKDDKLIMEIIDNGVGITNQNKKEINSYLKSNDIRSDNHIGLVNIDKKIKLIFGEQYGLIIDEAFIDGTKIILTQPLL